MNYTKGEWKLNDTAFSRYSTYRGKVSGARTFVVNEGLEQIAEAQGSTQIEAEANAHLIAAAPEMYEACKRAYRAIVNHHVDGERIAGTICEYCKGELDLLTQALAKADGK